MRTSAGLALLAGLAATVLVFGIGTALASTITYTCTGVQATDQTALNTDLSTYDVVTIKGKCIGNFLANTKNVTIQGKGSSPTLYGYDTTDPVLTVVGHTVTIDGVKITHGSNDGVSNGDGGGGIYAKNATVNLDGASVVNNQTTNGAEGGGIYLHHSTLWADASSISSNTADASGGGLVAAFGSPVTLHGSHVDGNTANGCDAGGISLDWSSKQGLPGGSSATLDASTVNDNTAQCDGDTFGGGIDVNHNTLTATDTKIEDNTASSEEGDGYGGGIFAKFSNVVLGTSNINSNTATYGGGIRIEGVPYTAALAKPIISGQHQGLSMYQSVCDDNTAHQDGGCLNNDSACFRCDTAPIKGSDGINTTPATINNTEIEYNEAENGNGGGIANTSESGNTASLLVTGGSYIAHNRADGEGGGISNILAESGGTATTSIDHTTMQFNRAYDGGGVAADGNGLTGTASLFLNKNAVIFSNTASDDGGGVWYANGATLAESGDHVYNNTPDDIN